MGIISILQRLVKERCDRSQPIDVPDDDLKRNDQATISAIVREISRLAATTALPLPHYESLVRFNVLTASGQMSADDAIAMMIRQVELCEPRIEPSAFGVSPLEQQSTEQLQEKLSQTLLNIRRLNAMRFQQQENILNKGNQ